MRRIQYYLALTIFLLVSCSQAVSYTPNPPGTPTDTAIPHTPPTETVVVPTLTTAPPTITAVPLTTEPASTLDAADYKLRSLIAYQAASQAVAKMPGKYSWEEFRTCSTFVSQYLRQLSFPVNGMEGQYGSYPDAFPWTNVVDQVNWLRKNYPQYTHDAPLADFLEGRLWNTLIPGDVIYLQTAENHNGYNTYFHTIVMIGYLDGEPIFAELASGMDNASANRTFEEMSRFYQDSGGRWKTNPRDGATQPLLVTWFDPFAILNEANLWQKPGSVIPNGKVVKNNFDQVVTINLYDGTTGIYRQTALGWEIVNVSGRENFYAVTGRLLPANNTIAYAFAKAKNPGLYDGDFGVYISATGVYQHTWTPQLLAKVTGFEYLNNFGDLPGPTFTSLMIPQIYDKRGFLKDDWDYSPFTFHRIPDVENQDMLLRQDLLIKANNPASPDHGPIPVPQVYLSSGCVNFDRDTWQILRDYLQSQLDSGQRIGVVFSYPNFDHDLLPSTEIFKSPFFGGQFNKWCPNQEGVCDPYNRRNYRDTYLNKGAK